MIRLVLRSLLLVLRPLGFDSVVAEYSARVIDAELPVDGSSLAIGFDRPRSYFAL